ncbi:ribonuclease H-like domain-containing protein [Fusarium avenaceum]|nr:ribonuclease H-like domain-containing protein [Fusarium avenaceum]
MMKSQKKHYSCEVCSAPVKNPLDLAKHCIETGHQANLCCKPCIRRFSSKEALSQHKLDKHGKSGRVASAHPQIQLNHNTTELPAAAEPYSFQDQNYTRLVSPDPNLVHHFLALNCHPNQRLKRQGYILPDHLNGGFNITQKNANIIRQSIATPAPNAFFPKRKAIALDCEMAGVQGGASELVSICVVDFFSGEILLNSLVKPRQPIIDWRTEIHGIGPANMSVAVASKEALDGWETAREEVLNLVNADTVIVGQSLHHDLKVLRIVHARVLDTAILTSDAAFDPGKRGSRTWGLQSLCADLLGLRIRHETMKHDAVEDTMAAREVALCCICYPENLQAWAKRARATAPAQKFKRPNQRRKKTKNTKPLPTTRNEDRSGDYFIDPYGYDDDDEILRWEDVVDWDTWPKSPPYSD